MNLRITSRTLLLAVGAILLVTTVLWLLIYNSFDPVAQAASRTEMLMEASQFLSQIVLATIVGGMVPLLFNWYAKQGEERRQAWEKAQEAQRLKVNEDNNLRRKLLESVIQIRAQVEKTRREFGLLPAAERKSGYRAAVERLLDARLQLSQVWQDTETWSGLYGGNGGEIRDGLAGMKDFLDGLIDEYKAASPQVQAADDGETARDLIAGLPCFGPFVVDPGGPAYEKEFLERDYRRVARIIRQSIMDSKQEIAPG
jgi:hypothetical protein